MVVYGDVLYAFIHSKKLSTAVRLQPSGEQTTSKQFYLKSFSPRQRWSSSSFLLALEVPVQGLAGDAGLHSA